MARAADIPEKDSKRMPAEAPDIFVVFFMKHRVS
jgi:hypothetical protein